MSAITLQSIFDRVYRHLLAQGKPSVLPDGSGCAYRGANGLACAVGCLIDDEHYDPKLEGSSVMDHDVETAVRASLGGDVPSDAWPMLADLLEVHDEADPKRWARELGYVADTYGLEAPS